MKRVAIAGELLRCCLADIENPRHVISQISGFNQTLHYVDMDQAILRRIANQVRRLIAGEEFLNDALPKLAH